MKPYIELSFGDGEYVFRLNVRQILAIEEKADTGIVAVYYQVIEGGARLGTLLEIIRQGLIGGEGGTVDGEPVTVNHHMANHLVTTYAEPPAATIQDITKLAQAILGACIAGYEPTDEAEKKSGKPKQKRAAVKKRTA